MRVTSRELSNKQRTENPRVTSPNLDKKSGLGIAGIAQLVEQRTENPRVTSSNLVPGT